MYWMDPELEELGNQVMREHADLHWIALVGFRIGYLASDVAKKKSDKDVYAECVKVSELYRAIVPYDFLVVAYLPNVVHMTQQQRAILMYHELLHVDTTAKGEPKVRAHDVEDFVRILDAYGMTWDK